MANGWTWKRMLEVGLALALTVGLSACGSGKPEASKAAAPASPAAKSADKAPAKAIAKAESAKKAPSLKDAGKKKASPADKKKAAKPAAVGRAPMNLVSNGAFTSWMKDGRPKGWKGSATAAGKTQGEKPGSAALQLKPSKGDSALSYPVKGALAGKKLDLSVTARVAKENALGVAVDYKTAGGNKTSFWYFDKSPAWKKETKQVALPADTLPDSVSVRLVLRGSDKPAEVAAVSLTPAS